MLDSALVRELYEHVFARSGPFDSLILELFESGQCEVLVWPGHLHERLAGAKGASHPADAAADTVRASYPIDSSVCNLLHVSDDRAAADRELIILARARRVIDAQRLGRSISMPPSGALAICQALELPTPFKLDSPDSSFHAAGAFSCAADALIDAQQRASDLASSINAYFQGNPAPILALPELVRRPSSWRDFLIRCGSASADKWKSLLLDRVVLYLGNLLPFGPAFHWVIGGSVAANHYGDTRAPADIDVRCSEETLDAICAQLGMTPILDECGTYRSRVASLELGGWSVEFSADLAFLDGRRVRVDREMSCRRTSLGYQSREDLLAELISLRRPPPKCDLARANRLMSQWEPLDREYLSHRLNTQGEARVSIFWGNT